MKSTTDSSPAYYGVATVSGATGNSFKTQINRRGKVFYLGLYSSADEAAGVVDVALRASLAWSDKASQPYNFQTEGRDDSVGGERAATQIRKMLEWLRTHYPTDEQALNEVSEKRQETPTDSFERLVNQANQIKGRADNFLADMELLRKMFYQSNARISELEKKLAWQDEQMVELRAENMAMSAEKQRISTERKYVFKPMTPGLKPVEVTFAAGSTSPTVTTPQPEQVAPDPIASEEDAEICIPGHDNIKVNDCE